ncbi:alpha/beta fold hydrolase [Puniceibacterium confluentis]|uniref:alpha/beta fold hydrolase n=1 Tax=Puniceibacterium confluentis TaxID=1958944 RepID=UPI0011B70999|nr:alpha/beta hydrolase [Puniceibacterium confluentis]
MLEPLILLPDMMCDARLFAPQLTAFSRHTAVTVAAVTQGERMEEIASGLLTVLPARFALAGAGLGGIVAMELLRRAPDRITRIALIATSPLAETPQEAAAREPQIIGAKTGRLAEVMREAHLASGLAPGAGRVGAMTAAMDMVGGMGAEVFVRQSRALQRRRDQQATLRRCKVPALVLCGRHDAVTPVKRHSFMAELIPHAELNVLEAGGHLPSIEAPDETLAALRAWMKQPYVLR